VVRAAERTATALAADAASFVPELPGAHRAKRAAPHGGKARRAKGAH
jgi:hypothetical protein